MTHLLSDDLMSQFREFVALRTALHFPESRRHDLERVASSAAMAFGFPSVEAFVRWVLTSALTREQLELLASHMTIHETYFWREPQVFEALEKHILPELIRKHRILDHRIRIWSAGCSSGEEPYSLAIAIRRAIPTLKDWNVTILATDISPQILQKATAGIYGEWSFRNAPTWLTDGYFKRTPDGKREITPEIRDMVTFAYLNLGEDVYPSSLNNTNAMDLIFCRNVLMYFAPDRAGCIGKSLHHALVEGGRLVVSASELSQQLFPQFAVDHYPGTIIYRKGPDRPRPATWVPFVQSAIPPTFLEPPTSAKVHTHPGPADPILACEGTAPSQGIAHQDALEVAVGPRDVNAAPPETRAQSVRTLANEGRLEEALAVSDGAIAADKMCAGLHYLRATILQELNRQADAVASINRALYLEPDLVMAHFALGNLAVRRDDVNRAKRHFDTVLALLSLCHQEQGVPEAEGLTAGRLREIVRATMQVGVRP